jgi:hypothetical protein
MNGISNLKQSREFSNMCKRLAKPPMVPGLVPIYVVSNVVKSANRRRLYSQRKFASANMPDGIVTFQRGP